MIGAKIGAIQIQGGLKNESDCDEDEELPLTRQSEGIRESYNLSHKRTDEIEDQDLVRSQDGPPIKSVNTDLTQIAMPLIRSGISMQSDMRMGWRPQIEVTGAPIPLYYDFEGFHMPVNPATGKEFVPLYLGPRFNHSLEMHKHFANKTLADGQPSYVFKEPPNMTLIKQIIKQTHKPEPPREFIGMNPALPTEGELVFDSHFESGNLDIAVKRRDYEYDLYMKVDTNTKGHHQWFYFSVRNPQEFAKKRVKFNVVNFTKDESLYNHGMRVCISRESANFRWIKGGDEISYKLSHINKQPGADGAPVVHKGKTYFMLSFTYEFPRGDDKTFFSYSFPYEFSKLSQFLTTQRQLIKNSGADILKESVLCQSLGGVDVPLIKISSRLTSDPQNYQAIDLQEFQDSSSRISLPFYETKKQIVVCARVHPGESNSSYMMQGFIRCLLGNSLQARELRKRCVFSIIPMTNPDGVIVGNYRTNMAGNDLNRKYLNPDEKLHPTVVAIKRLVSQLTYPDNDEEEVEEQDRGVFAFIDMHGHSRKKNVFVYGPYYALHHERYLKMRILPKLLSEETNKFRFFSCKFRIERSKEKAARIVLWREFDIMNCFTLEASFHGYLNEERETIEFTPAMLESMGEHLVNSLYEYFLILEEEDRQRKLKELNRKKKTKVDAMSHTQSESLGKKKKASQERGATFFRENLGNKRDSPRHALGNIAEEREEEEAALASFALNPNEPPETPRAGTVQGMREERKQPLISSTVEKRSHAGIRSLNQIYDLLRNDEISKRDKRTESDSSSDDQSKSPNKAHDGGRQSSQSKADKDSGSDSDPQEGDLTAEEQARVHSTIKGALDQFQILFNPEKAKQTGIAIIKTKTKKKAPVVKDQRNFKSPLPGGQCLKEHTQLTSTVKRLKELEQPTPVKVKKPPQSVVVKEEVKGKEFVVAQNQVKHQKVANQVVSEPPKQPILPRGVPNYQAIKQIAFGMPQHQYQQMLKEVKEGPKGPFQNPLIINKIAVDQLGAHEQNFHQSPAAPAKIGIQAPSQSLLVLDQPKTGILSQRQKSLNKYEVKNVYQNQQTSQSTGGIIPASVQQSGLYLIGQHNNSTQDGTFFGKGKESPYQQLNSTQQYTSNAFVPSGTSSFHSTKGSSRRAQRELSQLESPNKNRSLRQSKNQTALVPNAVESETASHVDLYRLMETGQLGPSDGQIYSTNAVRQRLTKRDEHKQTQEELYNIKSKRHPEKHTGEEEGGTKMDTYQQLSALAERLNQDRHTNVVSQIAERDMSFDRVELQKKNTMDTEEGWKASFVNLRAKQQLTGIFSPVPQQQVAKKFGTQREAVMSRQHIKYHIPTGNQAQAASQFLIQPNFQSQMSASKVSEAHMFSSPKGLGRVISKEPNPTVAQSRQSVYPHIAVDTPDSSHQSYMIGQKVANSPRMPISVMKHKTIRDSVSLNNTIDQSRATGVHGGLGNKPTRLAVGMPVFQQHRTSTLRRHDIEVPNVLQQQPLINSYSKERMLPLSVLRDDGTDRGTNGSGLKRDQRHKNFEEFMLPDPAGMRKRIQRAQNHTLHDSSRNEGYSHYAKLSPITELQPVDMLNSEAKRHSRYQHIIDTLLADQYPMMSDSSRLNRVYL